MTLIINLLLHTNILIFQNKLKSKNNKNSNERTEKKRYVFVKFKIPTIIVWHHLYEFIYSLY